MNWFGALSHGLLHELAALAHMGPEEKTGGNDADDLEEGCDLETRVVASTAQAGHMVLRELGLVSGTHFLDGAVVEDTVDLVGDDGVETVEDHDHSTVGAVVGVTEKVAGHGGKEGAGGSVGGTDEAGADNEERHGNDAGGETHDDQGDEDQDLGDEKEDGAGDAVAVDDPVREDARGQTTEAVTDGDQGDVETSQGDGAGDGGGVQGVEDGMDNRVDVVDVGEALLGDLGDDKEPKGGFDQEGTRPHIDRGQVRVEPGLGGIGGGNDAAVVVGGCKGRGCRLEDGIAGEVVNGARGHGFLVKGGA